LADRLAKGLSFSSRPADRIVTRSSGLDNSIINVEPETVESRVRASLYTGPSGFEAWLEARGPENTQDVSGSPPLHVSGPIMPPLRVRVEGMRLALTRKDGKELPALDIPLAHPLHSERTTWKNLVGH